jgi:hypothetical protein
MSIPTEEQILHVKNNIRNIINFNNYLYNQGNVNKCIFIIITS